jgi:UDP-galactopyranose mutase
VLIIDSRTHIAGNAHDVLDSWGHRVHAYGPHLFHTNSEEVMRFVSRFGAWRMYEHKVLSRVGEKLVPMPVCISTINGVFGVNISTEDEMRAFLAKQIPKSLAGVAPRNAEEAVVARMGRHLYEQLFKGYTIKQWGVHPAALDASVTNRIPLRFDFDDRYFTDSYQALPSSGYDSIFAEMLRHPKIELRLGVSYATSTVMPDRTARWLRGPNNSIQVCHAPRMVYTGPIDQFFDCELGRLKYRSLRFQTEHLKIQKYQEAPTVNEASEYVSHTRTTEFKQLGTSLSTATGTTIMREFPDSGGDPFYPMMTNEDRATCAKYEEMSEDPRRGAGALFIGRLAQYKYYNMDQAIASAMQKVRKACS